MTQAQLFSFDQLCSLLKALPDPAFILTQSGVYAAIFGGTDLRYYHDGSTLIGLRMHDVLTQAKADWFAEQIAIALAHNTLHIVEYGLSGHDVKGLEDNGPQDEIWFEGRVQSLDFPVLNEAAVLWVASNITARHQLEKQLREQSETDALTGLYNRRKLMAILDDYRALAKRYGTETVVLLFDIDAFKSINDAQGHQIGDKVLIEVARSCQSLLRTTDVCARLGGDEFVVLLPHTSIQEADSITQRLRIQISEHLKQLDLSITISGGLSSILASDEDNENALSRADTALYQAKRLGRNQIARATC